MKSTLGMKKLVFLFLAAPAFGYAGSADLCSDLASFSCAPGQYDDGTGTAETMMFKDGFIPAGLKDEVSEKLSAGFSELVKKPENSYFRSSAISALGLGAAPDCQSKETSAFARCNKVIVSGLTMLARKGMVTEISSSSSSSSMQSNPTNQIVVDNLKELSTLTKNAQYEEVVSSVTDVFEKRLRDSNAEKKISENMFPKLKKLLADRINSLPIEDSKKQFMIAKVKAIAFAGTDCDESIKNLSRHLIPNAFYNPEKNALKVCQGLLHDNISEFHVASVIVHELAHSIDPCCLAKGIGENIVKHRDTTNLALMDSEYVLPNLISCLRSPMSVNAQNQQQPMVQVGSYGYMGGQFGTPPSTALDHCRDQIGESIADWFAGEVITDYIQEAHPNLTSEQWRIGASNIFRPLCSFNDFGIIDTHPATFNRINSVFLQNPKLRQKMKCPSDDPTRAHCDGTEATAVVPPANPYATSNPYGPLVVPPAAPNNPMPTTPGSGRVVQ